MPVTLSGRGPVAEAVHGGLPKPLQMLSDLFLPPDDPIVPPTPLMGVGKGIGNQAGKGLVKGIKGFQLPGGRVARPDAEGVMRISEGLEAESALKKMTEPSISAQNRMSGAVPTVTDASHLSDVAVPIADSLDTNASSATKLIGKWSTGLDQLKMPRSKFNHSDIISIRELYDSGVPMKEIAARYPKVSPTTVMQVATRESYSKVK